MIIFLKNNPENTRNGKSRRKYHFAPLVKWEIPPEIPFRATREMGNPAGNSVSQHLKNRKSCRKSHFAALEKWEILPEILFREFFGGLLKNKS